MSVIPSEEMQAQEIIWASSYQHPAVLQQHVTAAGSRQIPLYPWPFYLDQGASTRGTVIMGADSEHTKIHYRVSRLWCCIDYAIVSAVPCSIDSSVEG